MPRFPIPPGMEQFVIRAGPFRVPDVVVWQTEDNRVWNNTKGKEPYEIENYQRKSERPEESQEAIPDDRKSRTLRKGTNGQP